MSNAYQYEDSKNIYIDPKTGVLKNLAGFSNYEDLHFFESITVSKRLNELYENPLKIVGVKSLFLIHHHLFQDVYSWAGKKRVVEISKDGKEFIPTLLFENAFRFIDDLITEYRHLRKNQKQKIAEKLAEIIDSVNYLHPFREGNGRAQREFIRLLAWEKEYILNLNPPDKNVFDRYMQGTVNSDTKILADLIFELLKKDRK
jgi:cell filamentation protein